MYQRESPCESIPKMKLFGDMEKLKGTDHIPLVGSYVFQKCFHARNHPLEPTCDRFCPPSSPLTLYGRGQICQPLHEFLNFLFSLYKHMLRLVDFSCMSIAVLLQKILAFYVPWFNFDGVFFDKKSGLQIANFLFFSNFAKHCVFSKSSQGYIFWGR